MNAHSNFCNVLRDRFGFNFHRDDRYWTEGTLFTRTGNRLHVSVPKPENSRHPGIFIYFWDAPAPQRGDVNEWFTYDGSFDGKPTYSEKWEDLDPFAALGVIMYLLKRDGTLPSEVAA